MTEIIRGANFDLRGVAFEIEVTFRLGVGDRASARADETGAALHLAAGLVGHLGFETIGIIPLFFFIRLRHLEFDREMAV